MSESSLVLPPRLPGVFELIDQSVALYRARFNSIALLALSVWAVSTLIFVIVGLAILGLDALGLIIDMTSALVYMGIPVVFGVGGLMVWSSWGTMAFYHLYRAEGVPTLREAFSQGRPYLLPYLWVSILALAVQIGFILISVGIGVGLGVLLPTSLTVPLVFLLVLGSMGGYIALCTRLAFTGWCLVSGRGSGFGALKASARLVAGRTLPVLGRFLGLFGCYLGASFLINICIGIVSALFPPFQILGVVANLLVSPVFGITSFLLFRALTDTPRVSTHGE